MRRVRIALVMVLVLFLSTPASSTRTNPWGQSGGGDGVAGTGNYAAMTAYTASVGDLWWLVDQATAVCTSDGGGTADTLCAWDGAAWIAAGVAGGGWVGTATSDLAMGANDITLSATQTVDGVDVSDPTWTNPSTFDAPYSSFGDSAVTTEAELEAAITACGDGVGGSPNDSAGCTINVCGNITTDGISIGGATLATAKNGLSLIGCGSGQANSGDDRLAGATIRYSDATGGGTVLSINNVTNLRIQGIDIDGSNAGAGTDAEVGLSLEGSLSGSGWSTSGVVLQDISIQNVNGYAIDVDNGGDDEQIDLVRMENVQLRDNVGCYQQNSTQALLNVFVSSECANSTGTTLFHIIAGMLTVQDSYIGISTNSTKAFDLGDEAHNFYASGNHIELNATTGNTVVEDGSGTSNLTSRQRVFDRNQVTYTGASNVLFSVQRRGNWTVSNSVFFGSANVPTTSTWTNPAGSGDNRSHLTVFGTYQRNADSGSALAPEIWFPSTIGSAIVVETPPVAAAALDTGCLNGRIGIDTDATGGAQWNFCESNAWVSMAADDYTWTGDHAFDGLFSTGTQETFTTGDLTPDVSSGSHFLSHSTQGLITDFDGSPVDGQLLVVQSGGTDTDFDCTVNTLLNCGSVDILTETGDVTTWIYDATTPTWNLVAYMDADTDMGTDATGGAGSSEWTDLGSVVHLNETDDDVSLGSVTLINSSKLSIDGDFDQVQFTIQGDATQTDSIMIVENSAGTEVINLDKSGDILAQSIQDIDGPGTLWSIDSAGDATFNSVTTAASDTAELRLTSSTDSGDVSVGLTEGATTNNTIMDLSVQDDGTEADVDYVTLNGETKTVNLGMGDAVTTIGDGGTTNYLSVSTAGVMSAAGSGAINLGTGTIRGAVDTTTSGATPWTMGAAEGQWIFFDEAGAGQVDMPALSDGASFCIYSTVAQVISLNPSGSENIFLDGATIGAGDELDSPGALGDFVCLLSNGTNWYVMGMDGTWVDGGAT